MMTGASSYQDAWAKTISPSSAWMPGFAVMSQTLVACICYSIIIGDLGYDLLKGLGIEGWFAVRNNLLAAVSVSLLLPLCLLRDFAMLSYTSMLGVAGVMYTACFMVLRKVQGAYARGGAFYSAIPKDSTPTFGSRFEAVKTLILMATLNTAFQAHYDAPKFFDLMTPRTVEQFNKLVFPSFLAAGTVSCVCMAAGFLTFGGNANGLILNSYAASDKLAVFGVCKEPYNAPKRAMYQGGRDLLTLAMLRPPRHRVLHPLRLPAGVQRLPYGPACGHGQPGRLANDQGSHRHRHSDRHDVRRNGDARSGLPRLLRWRRPGQLCNLHFPGDDAPRCG